MLSARILTKITSDRSFWSWSTGFPQMLVPLALVRGPLLLLQYWASPARRGWRGDPTRFSSDTIPSNSNHPVPVRLLIHSVVVIAFQISYQRFASPPHPPAPYKYLPEAWNSGLFFKPTQTAPGQTVGLVSKCTK